MSFSYFSRCWLLLLPSPSFAGDRAAPDADGDGLPVVTQWGDGAFSEYARSTKGETGESAAAAQACVGEFGEVQETADGAQYGGWTQCNGPHELTLRMALYRWDASTESYRFLASVYNSRFAWYVGAVGAEACDSQLFTRYKMRAFPTMDGIQMEGYAGWSEPFTISCRVYF